ncbi:UNVERIFIED_CONTAM: transcription factor WhiB [Williamsia faeni]
MTGFNGGGYVGGETGWDWRVHGRCRTEDVDSNIFFPPAGREFAKERRRREAAAKSICGHCPVARECRSHAERYGEKYGIWGGLTVGELAG